METMRRAIAAGRFDFCDTAKKAWRTGETKPISLSGAESSFGRMVRLRDLTSL